MRFRINIHIKILHKSTVTSRHVDCLIASDWLRGAWSIWKTWQSLICPMNSPPFTESESSLHCLKDLYIFLIPPIMLHVPPLLVVFTIPWLYCPTGRVASFATAVHSSPYLSTRIFITAALRFYTALPWDGSASDSPVWLVAPINTKHVMQNDVLWRWHTVRRSTQPIEDRHTIQILGHRLYKLG
jgi:hypothetical protein